MQDTRSQASTDLLLARCAELALALPLGQRDPAGPVVQPEEIHAAHAALAAVAEAYCIMRGQPVCWLRDQAEQITPLLAEEAVAPGVSASLVASAFVAPRGGWTPDVPRAEIVRTLEAALLWLLDNPRQPSTRPLSCAERLRQYAQKQAADSLFGLRTFRRARARGLSFAAQRAYQRRLRRRCALTLLLLASWRGNDAAALIGEATRVARVPRPTGALPAEQRWDQARVRIATTR
ncbi:MAG TPA: hypothetical protein VF178_05340 [Gemmatimonadaceae bacterium]